MAKVIILLICIVCGVYRVAKDLQFSDVDFMKKQSIRFAGRLDDDGNLREIASFSEQQAQKNQQLFKMVSPEQFKGVWRIYREKKHGVTEARAIDLIRKLECVYKSASGLVIKSVDAPIYNKQLFYLVNYEPGEKSTKAEFKSFDYGESYVFWAEKVQVDSVILTQDKGVVATGVPTTAERPDEEGASEDLYYSLKTILFNKVMLDQLDESAGSLQLKKDQLSLSVSTRVNGQEVEIEVHESTLEGGYFQYFLAQTGEQAYSGMLNRVQDEIVVTLVNGPFANLKMGFVSERLAQTAAAEAESGPAEEAGVVAQAPKDESPKEESSEAVGVVVMGTVEGAGTTAPVNESSRGGEAAAPSPQESEYEQQSVMFERQQQIEKVSELMLDENAWNTVGGEGYAF